MKSKQLLILLFVFLNFIVLGNEKQYAITTTGLNLREGKSSNFNAIKILNKGDTLELLSEELGWSKVKIGNSEGYVSSNFIQKINYHKEETFADQKGFVSGFKFVFFRAFIIVLLLLIAFYTYKARKKDGRFKKGYQQLEVNTKSWIISSLIAGVIALLSGVIGGLISLTH